jgi:hypothetical protein
MDLVREHTLGDPDKLRIFRGMTHQEFDSRPFARSNGVPILKIDTRQTITMFLHPSSGIEV